MRRILVTQADARLRGGRRDPLAVGVARWRGHGEDLAIVLKLTLEFGESDEAVVGAPRALCRTPELSPHTTSEGDEDLATPADFLLFKPHCDVLVVGHAHAPQPSERIDVSVTLGAHARRFIASAATPTLTIPLSSRHVHDEQGHPVTLAPQPVTREPAQADYASFEHAGLQSASPAMQLLLDALAPQLHLVGLSPRRAERTITLPALAPAAWAERRGQLTPLALHVDTVLIDADFERIDLVWRGLVPEHAIDVDRFLVSLEERGATSRDVAAVSRDLPRGTVSWAMEETDELTADDEELEMASYEVLEHAALPEMSLEEFAAVSARLAEQDRPRDQILDDLDLDERTFGIEERAWVQTLGDRASAGDGTLTSAFADHFLAAQDRLRGEHEPRSLEVYAKMKAAMERSDKPQTLLAAEKVTFGEWMRLERHWNDQAGADPAVGVRLAELLQGARAASAGRTPVT